MFSIIVAAYNEEKHIADMIDSILNQSYADFELIIVDDGSTDKTFEIIEEKQLQDNRIKAFSPGKLGKNGAFNYGVSQADGDWFMLFAGDDLMEAGILEKWHNITVTNDYNSSVVIMSRIRMFSDSNKYNRYDGIEIPKDKHKVCNSGAAFLASRAVMEDMFPIPDNYPNEDDWISLYIKYFVDKKMACCNVCTNYRIHDGNSLNKNAKYEIFNEQYHKRKIVIRDFLKRYDNKLDITSSEKLKNDLLLEDYRYTGKTLKLLFANSIGFAEKMRLVLLSNKPLYIVKLIANRFLLGRA